MKTKTTRSFIYACLALCMLAQSSALYAAGNPIERKEVKTKISASRNNSSVRIYPDAIKRVMHVVAKDNETPEVDFFVFDLEGTIIKHYKMKSGAHEKLTDLERGKYVFRVFSGDEETAMGKFEIR